LEAFQESDEYIGSLEDHADEPAGGSEAEDEEDRESAEGDPDDGDECAESGADESGVADSDMWFVHWVLLAVVDRDGG
jgi:hypothetical protein